MTKVTRPEPIINYSYAGIIAIDIESKLKGYKFGKNNGGIIGCTQA